MGSMFIMVLKNYFALISGKHFRRIAS